MSVLHLVAIYLAVLCVATVVTAESARKPYQRGDTFQLECLSDDARTWGPGPVCDETGEPISFKYGTNSLVSCTLAIDDSTYRRFQSIVARKSSWTCRVPMEAGKEWFVPLYLPLWGVIEEDHMHVNTHMNFIFHGNMGEIIGAAVYPARDRFLYFPPEGSLTFHGPVRWFSGHSFKPLSGAGGTAPPAPTGYAFKVVVAVGMVAAASAAVAGAILYRAWLKPRLIASVLKEHHE